MPRTGTPPHRGPRRRGRRPSGSRRRRRPPPRPPRGRGGAASGPPRGPRARRRQPVGGRGAAPAGGGRPPPPPRPGAGEELHRADRAVPAPVAVNGSGVGVTHPRDRSGAVQRDATDQRRGHTVRAEGGAGVATVVGLDPADRGQQRPGQPAARVDLTHHGGRRPVGTDRRHGEIEMRDRRGGHHPLAARVVRDLPGLRRRRRDCRSTRGPGAGVDGDHDVPHRSGPRPGAGARRRRGDDRDGRERRGGAERESDRPDGVHGSCVLIPRVMERALPVCARRPRASSPRTRG